MDSPGRHAERREVHAAGIAIIVTTVSISSIVCMTIIVRIVIVIMTIICIVTIMLLSFIFIIIMILLLLLLLCLLLGRDEPREPEDRTLPLHHRGAVHRPPMESGPPTPTPEI